MTDAIDADLTPLPVLRKGAEQYFSYACRQCGKPATNSYSEPYRTRLLESRRCFSCDHWNEFATKAKIEDLTIIEGHIYGPGNRTSGSLRGMAGRRFDIEYIAPSRHAGKRITTFDLWSGGTMPDAIRAQFPDTAKFLNGAERAQVGETTCWDGSSNKAEPYPLPSSLGIR